MADGPDGRIPSAASGIEVSELLAEKPDGAIFSPPQLAGFQSEVVREAARLFSGTHAHPADVLVFFNNDWDRRRDIRAVAQALADFVANNYPEPSKSVCLQNGPRAVGWVDGLSVVRIIAEDGRWQAAGCSDIAVLTYDQVASRIAEKSRRVQEYRKRLPGWHMWLLLATRFNVLCSASVPPEVESWRFTSHFDRMVLSSWEYGVLQLNCTEP